MKLINTKNSLPNNNQYVLAYFPDSPWIDSDAKNTEHKWVVVKFQRGLSVAEREALPETNERKGIVKDCDEGESNHVPYGWVTFGPAYFFGQEAKYWSELPKI